MQGANVEMRKISCQNGYNNYTVWPGFYNQTYFAHVGTDRSTKILNKCKNKSTDYRYNCVYATELLMTSKLKLKCKKGGVLL